MQILAYQLAAPQCFAACKLAVEDLGSQHGLYLGAVVGTCCGAGPYLRTCWCWPAFHPCCRKNWLVDFHGAFGAMNVEADAVESVKDAAGAAGAADAADAAAGAEMAYSVAE